MLKLNLISITKTYWVPFLVASSMPVVQSGLLAYGICQTGCNALVVSCYAAAGFTFGTVTG